MVCRHEKGDPNCSSTPGGYAQLEQERRHQEATYAATPDATKYHIVDVVRCGAHLVMRIKYPNCSACAYEGEKVMVFLNVTESQVLKWKRIDPHFRDPKSRGSVYDAPSPAARFPANSEGWRDAVVYANSRK